MKKLRTTLFVCLTALAVLTAFGCKQEAAIGDKVKAWGSPGADRNLRYQLVLTVDNSDNELGWYAITDNNNVRVDVSPAKEKVDGKWVYKWDFQTDMGVNKSKDYYLYIYQPDVKIKVNNEEKTAQDAKKTFRGRVSVTSSQGVTIKASKYAQIVDHVGFVTIKNNETANTDGYGWTGNYDVTRVIPLQKQTSGKYTFVNDYEAKNDEGLIKEGETKTLLMPAGQFTPALKQPKRLTDADKADTANIIEHIKKLHEKYPGESCFPNDNLKDDASNVKAYLAYQEDALWVPATDITVPAHNTYTTTLLTDKNTRYIVEGSDTVKSVLFKEYPIYEAPAGEK